MFGSSWIHKKKEQILSNKSKRYIFPECCELCVSVYMNLSANSLLNFTIHEIFSRLLTNDSFYYYLFFSFFSFMSLNLWRINTIEQPELSSFAPPSTTINVQQRITSATSLQSPFKPWERAKHPLHSSPRIFWHRPIENIYCHSFFLHNQLFFGKLSTRTKTRKKREDSLS